MFRVLLIAAVLAAAPLVANAEPAASPITRALNASAAGQLPLEDSEDEDFASRGFVATFEGDAIRGPLGNVIWSFKAFEGLAETPPDSVHPSLWRHTRLLAKHGLFKVHERVYQVRGFDLANMTVIVGDTGYIIVDPLTMTETAAAAMALVRQHLGDKPVVAVLFTHNHGDHFGGAKGVIDPADAASGKVPVIAPEGFLEHAVAENIIAGNAMSRRASYQFGNPLPQGPAGTMGSAIGMGLPKGTFSLIAPNDEVKTTGEERVIDGVRLVFHMASGTEAPAEFNFFLPDFKVLLIAETAGGSIHNILTPRGALVRDAKLWADSLTEALRLFGAQTDIFVASHFWPRFGNDRIVDFLSSHRNAYKYLHDQSVRLMNMGLTGPEIAERIALPESLAKRWFNRGYYGAMRFNSRAVYQRYLGWYDGNPASLAPYPAEEAGARYVAAMGGPAKVLEEMERARGAGDYRWAAELGRHLVFAEPGNMAAREAMAGAFEQLAFQAENALWRNMYLTGALELRQGAPKPGPELANLDVIAATPTGMLLDLMAVRVNPKVAEGLDVSLNIAFPDRGETFVLRLKNSVLVHEAGVADPGAIASMTGKRAAFLTAAFRGIDLRAAELVGQADVQGDAGAFATLFGVLDKPDPSFPIVTP